MLCEGIFPPTFSWHFRLFSLSFFFCKQASKKLRSYIESFVERKINLKGKPYSQHHAKEEKIEWKLPASRRATLLL